MLYSLVYYSTSSCMKYSHFFTLKLYINIVISFSVMKFF